MKNHNQGFSDLIGDSPHALALCSLLVGHSPDLPTSWEELMATRVRFDFPYSSFLLDTVNKTTTMVPYTPEGFEGTVDKPKIPNLLSAQGTACYFVILSGNGSVEICCLQ
jgi:hypothetical protein